MSGYERKQSPLFAKTEEFIVWLLRHTSKFPRQYRHTLTERLENSALEFQRCLGVALITKKSSALDTADLELWQMKQLLRVANDIGVLPARLLKYTFESVEELGRLLGAWKKKGGGT